MRNFEKLDMASVDWLTTHYLAKSADRVRTLSQLPINPGATVLDLCCGPGLFMSHLLDLVGPSGHVTGLDIDAVSLDAAHERLLATPHRNWDLVHKPFEPRDQKFHDYDVVLMLNCIGYFEDPFEIIRSLTSGMKRGAKLVIKDFDLESFFFHPRDTFHWAALIGPAKVRNAENNPVKFDNFLGRKIHTFHQTGEFANVENTAWVQLMSTPFSPAEREYIWRNIECLILQSGDLCSAETIEYFKDQFFPPKQKFFDADDAVFVEVEYVSILTI